MLTRRTFFKTAGLGAAAAAASVSLPSDLLAWAEPSRAPQPDGPILLNSNENAYGPFPSLLSLSNPFHGVNRYPDHPTANLTPRRDLEDFINKLPRNTYVLVDEAYHDFVGANPDYVSFLDRPLDDSRVIVARTFSKIYGLAGMRMGYAIAAKQTAGQMREHK